MNKSAKEFREMSGSQLAGSIEEMRRGLMGLRLNAATGHVKKTSEYKLLRREIARALTIFNEKVNTQAQELYREYVNGK